MSLSEFLSLSAFTENTNVFSLPDTVITFFLSLCLGIFLCIIYRKTYKGVRYSRTFSFTLIGFTFLSAAVMLAVQSNIILSVGMVGALSIVRFRSTLTDPLENAFLFWAVAAGIVLAAGMIPLAVIGSVIIGITLLLLANRKTNENNFILVLKCQNHDAEVNALAFLDQCVTKKVIKSKSVSNETTELSIEICLDDNNTDFINTLTKMPYINSAVVVSKFA